ncbi:TlpA family protein disulfide reductase [Pseudotenacibaculum haliotis]|uniref:TlpA family protein disulfide reductase n=1 Tax=Pseudotenacibaculum haliotis TaxID=1862138 RepID=A0ABW5LXM4_9FLAO
MADLNLYLSSNLKIDSVFVSNIAQDREFYILPYSDTLRVQFKDSINDMYNIWFFTQEGRRTKQLWLNGKNLIIKGSIGKRFEIDTVLGSDLFYKAQKFQKEYRQLYKEKAKDEVINQLLIRYTKENINNPLSLQTADYYLYKNKNDKEKVRNLQSLLKDQPKAFKDHLAFPVHKSIDKILSQHSIDLKKYDFEDIAGNTIKIETEPSKKYLLDLWFVNCPPCIKDHQKFLKNPNLLKQKNIELIGISTDRQQKVWSGFLQEKQYPWKNYRQKQYAGSLTEDLMISVFPTYFLIEGNGKIIQTFNAFDDIKDYLSNEL